MQQNCSHSSQENHYDSLKVLHRPSLHHDGCYFHQSHRNTSITKLHKLYSDGTNGTLICIYMYIYIHNCTKCMYKGYLKYVNMCKKQYSCCFIIVKLVLMVHFYKGFFILQCVGFQSMLLTRKITNMFLFTPEECVWTVADSSLCVKNDLKFNSMLEKIIYSM